MSTSGILLGNDVPRLALELEREADACGRVGRGDGGGLCGLRLEDENA